MNATDFRLSLSTRLAALAVAMIASSVVLGATVAGMQPRDEGIDPGHRARARHGARHAGELRRCARGALRPVPRRRPRRALDQPTLQHRARLRPGSCFLRV